MEKLYVENENTKYPIYIENSFDGLLEVLEKAGFNKKKVCIICDSNTEKLYLNEVLSIVKKCFLETSYFSFEAGEKSKNLDVIRDFYTYFIDKKMDRKSAVIALGGGVVGDMAGFAAATFMRGIDFIQIPTTLLSQVDSSVGGKVGVDFLGNKNMIGAFYQPKLVFINTSTLSTLPSNEFAAGMAEAIKYGYIINLDYLNFINQNKNSIKNLEHENLLNLILGSCSAKAYVVSKDEKETGLREILNFGHTFGHAIETLSGFSYLHGECVSIGIIAALKLSFDRGYIDKKDLNEAEELFRFFNLPIRANGYDRKKIFEQMLLDKKTKNNKLNIILLDKMGYAYTEKDVSEKEVFNAIDYIL